MRIDSSKTRSKLAVITLVALMCVALMPVVCMASGSSRKASNTTDYAYALATYAGVFSTSVVTSVNPTATLAVLSILGAIENAAVYSPDSAFFNTIADFLNGVPIIREAGKLPISNPYAAVFLSIVAAVLIVIHSTAVSELVSKKISLDKLDTIALNIGNVALSLLPLVTNEALAKDPPGVSLMVRSSGFGFSDVPWYTYLLAFITLIVVTVFSNIIRKCMDYWETIVAAFPVKGTSLIWQIVKAILHIILMILMIFAPVICFVICVHLAVAAVFLFRILKRNCQYYTDVYVFTILRRIFKHNDPVERVEKNFPRKLKKLYPDSSRTIYEHDTQFGPCNYFTDGRFCWVKVGVTVEGHEEVEELAVMDYRNAAIPLNQITSANVINAIQRCGTKAIARHGLGLHIYRGEDTPDEEAEKKKREEELKLIKEAQEETKGKNIAGVVTAGKIPTQDDVPPAYQLPI